MIYGKAKCSENVLLWRQPHDLFR